MDKILFVSDVARLLHCSADTVRRQADEGKLPVTKTERGVRIFREADVLTIASQRTAAEGS